MLKQIMIPVAAFAVTVTGASAFTGDMLEKMNINLSSSEVAALEEVHEMRIDGATRDEVHAVLDEAGLGQEEMAEIREAAREYRDEMRVAKFEALEHEDYDTFMEAIEGTRLAEVIENEADFEALLEAHNLRQDGEYEEAREIMEELGVTKGPGAGYGHRQGGYGEGLGDGNKGARGAGEGLGDGHRGANGGDGKGGGNSIRGFGGRNQ